MGSASLSQSGITATASWSSGSTVTVTITSWGGYNENGVYWRVRGLASEGDSRHYITETRESSASFSATDGKGYAFQVCPSGTWTDGSIFYVNFGSSGGGSGGDSGGSDGEYQLLIYTDGIATVTVTIAETGEVLRHGSTIYYGDDLKIVFSVPDGYELSEHHVDYAEFTSGQVHTVYGYVQINASAIRKVGVIYIDNGTTFEAYECYIDNGTSWDACVPYIDNGTSWEQYG